MSTYLLLDLLPWSEFEVARLPKNLHGGPARYAQAVLAISNIVYWNNQNYSWGTQLDGNLCGASFAGVPNHLIAGVDHICFPVSVEH
jgi:hypothetical protein